MENRNGLYVAVSVADATAATEPGVVTWSVDPWMKDNGAQRTPRR
jgi:hypothetical protein